MTPKLRFARFLLLFAAGLAACQAQTINSVLNAASYQPLVGPGTWVAIFGTQFASGESIVSTLPFPTSVNGVSVTVGTTPLLLTYVGPSQINAFIPFSVTGSSAPVTVTTPSGASKPFPVALNSAAQGVYTKDYSGSGAALAFDGNFKPVTQLGSDAVILYATGLGPTDPPASADGIGASAEPLNRVISPVSVTIGGAAANVLYAGLAPGLPGIYQINLVPPPVVFGGALAVRVGGLGVTQNVTLPIASGANVTNLKGQIDGLYPSSAAGAAPVTPLTNAFLTAGTLTTSFDIVPNAKPFQIVAQVSSGSTTLRGETITIDPTAGTWTASIQIPAAATRVGDFSKAGFTVVDYASCSTQNGLSFCQPFPGNFLPGSRLDPVALKAQSFLPQANTSTTNGPNATYTASGTLPAGGRFSIGADSLPDIASFGPYINLPWNGVAAAGQPVPFNPPATASVVFQLYVDNQLVSTQTVPILVPKH